MEGLRDQALAEMLTAIESAAAEERPALAVLRTVVDAIARIARERRVEALGASEAVRESEELAAALLPVLDRVRQAAEIAPRPPEDWQLASAAHLLDACVRRADDPVALFDSIATRLDRGLVVLDPDGSRVCMNPSASLLLGDGDDLLFEDGAPCPEGADPLSVAARSMQSQSAVIGHRGEDGTIRWIAMDARVLAVPGREPHGVLGMLADVTAERDWELTRLREPGHLGGERPVPLDIARVLDEIPPHLFPEQFVSEARRVSGGPVALYVLDIDGTHLLRLAGPEDFPAHLETPLALGPELAADGMPALKERIEAEMPGVSMAALWIRGRAVGLLLGLRASGEALTELARHGAAALELAGGYTDVIDGARRRKPTQAAAELQQSLLPPRIARFGGGELAGTVLPSYEVGGDWFDYVENRDGAWIAIADAAGKGAAAGALGSVALAALRAARRSEQSLEEAARSMHEVVYDVGALEFYLTAIVARWNAVYSVFSWISCGHPPPLVLRPDNTIEQLMTEPGLPLGLMERDRRFVRRQRRLEEGELLILHSDGITARKTADGLFGLDGIERAVRTARSRSAPAIARSIQEAVLTSSEDPLQDDAVAVVLAPEPGESAVER
jgi:PAS domain-containing protein